MRKLTLGVPRGTALRGGCLTLGLGLALALSASSVHAGDAVVSSSGAAATVAIEDFAAAHGTVSGVLVNKSSRVLRDVQLLIRYTWLWKNEQAPGRDNPGRSEFYTVPGEIPAGGSVPFTYRPLRPLPNRSDGRFDISAQIVEFTEVGE